MTTLTAQQEDPFLFLEDIDSKGAMDFVNAHNTSTVTRLMSEKTYAPIYNKVLEALNSTDRIAYPTIAGDYIYNFWQDLAPGVESHLHGRQPGVGDAA